MKPRSLSQEERVDWLRLARAESVGPVTFRHLISRYGTAAPAIAALPELARRGGRDQAPRIPSRTEILAELQAGEAAGAQLLAWGEPAFPIALAALDAPPPVLWTLGDASLLHRGMVAIVGARIASAGGRRIARDLAAALSEAGWVVVSGMARGIDAAAHEGALTKGTIAVLAGGVDEIYPLENASLYDAMAARGLIVSERAMGVKAKAADFPRRNRIISGLSRGVIVVEAELRSGSLITARLAGEQGREVFAVPGSPLDPRSRGANELLRQGATLVEDAEDVLRVLEALPGLSEPSAPMEDRLDRERGSSQSSQSVDVHDRILGLLSPTPVTIDQLAREADMPIPAILAALTELSLAGRADLLPGGFAVTL